MTNHTNESYYYSIGDLANNVTANSLGSIWALLAGLVVLVVLVGVLMLAASEVERYRRVRELLARVGRFLQLALKGGVAAVLVGVVFSPFLALARADASTQAAVGEWTLIVGAVVTLLACIGLVAEWVWDELQARRAELADREAPAEAEEVSPDA